VGQNGGIRRKKSRMVRKKKGPPSLDKHERRR
jgi:hypothetical protein